ncbi:predicted protein [Plenodomus lingam JN3]|uniref:Predicted protein n=1 Tax=Leptosphaeria maculans (strain JN3 / isolate v23.1.3 / race Av1-4-5-6-7-8) TaxID=985895 RepID=E4ZYC3_LEPMJ|nr:predicted protein [Plenodomus lingam JN3]CBX96368.1 predicted protein [Plenodomus lingam JN3]
MPTSTYSTKQSPNWPDRTAVPVVHPSTPLLNQFTLRRRLVSLALDGLELG